MKTEEIIFALRCTASVPQIDHDCGKCPYHEDAVFDGLGEFEGCDVDRVALDAADRLEQLKREQERERPRPLTLDELRQMDGEPVWLQGTIGWIYTGWHIVKWRAGNCISICETQFCSKWISVDDYGELFIAYRHKPKGELMND